MPPAAHGGGTQGGAPRGSLLGFNFALLTVSGTGGMSDDHPNIRLLQRLDLRDLPGCADLFAEDFVWRYFNPKLPDLQGDFVGVTGLGEFFRRLRTTARAVAGRPR